MRNYWKWRKTRYRKVTYAGFPENPAPTRQQLHWHMYEGYEIIATLGIVPSTDGVRIAGMAKKNSYGGITFIPYRLHPDDEPVYTAWWDQEQQNVARMVRTCIESGYKLSIVPDFENACTIVTIIGKDCIEANKGKAYSSRAEDWLEAMGLTMYKHFVLSAADAWPDRGQLSNWG